MQYLKHISKMTQNNLITQLSACEANYVTAWTLLAKRYENERIIISKHMDKILDMQPIKKSTATNLIYLYDAINDK